MLEIWLAVDENGSEMIFDCMPVRLRICWLPDEEGHSMIQLPRGTIEKISGMVLTWDDEPVCIMEDE